MNMMLLGRPHRVGRAPVVDSGPVVALVTGHGGSSWLSPGLDDPARHQRGLPGADPDGDLILAGVISLPPLWLYLLGGAGSLTSRLCGRGRLDGRVSRDTGSVRPVLAGGGFTQGLHDRRGNPKDILFFVAFFPQFIAVTPHFGTNILTLPWYGSSSICWCWSLCPCW